MLFGILIILLLIIISGLIAYLGNKVGRRVGKRRVSIFGLRPKYTSNIITVLTGVVIVSITLAILFAVSQTARTAIFDIQRITTRLKTTEEAFARNRSRYIREENKLRGNIAKYRAAARNKQAELDEIRGEINLQSVKLRTLESSSKEMAARVTSLEKKKRQLENEITTLTRQHADSIGKTNKDLLFGDIIYRKDQPLGRIRIAAPAKKSDTSSQIMKLANDIFKDAILSGATVEKDAGEILVQQITSIDNTTPRRDMVIEARSHTNVLSGQPLYIRLAVIDDRIIYRRGEVIEREIIAKNLSQTEVNSILARMLTRASAEARDNGMIPDIETGRIGVVTAKRYMQAVADLTKLDHSHTVELITTDDIHIYGRLNVDFRHSPN